MQKIKIKNGIIEGLVDIEEVNRNLLKEKEYALIQNFVSDEVIQAIGDKPEAMRTLSEQQKLEIRKNIDQEFEKKLSEYDDYKELVVIQYRDSYNEETETLTPHFTEYDNRVEQTFTPRFDRYKVKKLIENNQKILTDTDYIIIKSYEAKLAMLDAPYSQEYLDEVLSKRQAARDKINELETLLNK